MENSKLVQVLKSLEKKEYLELRKFLQSPYFNHREDVLALYELLLAALKKKKPLPDKSTLYAALFPGKPYRDAPFHLVVSYLFKLVEQYLSVQDFLRAEKHRKLSLIRSYRRRNLPGHFRQVANRLKNEIEEHPIRDSTFYEQCRNLYWEEYQMKVAVEPSSRDLYLDDLSQMTDLAYYSQKIRQVCLHIVHRSIYKIGDPQSQEFPIIAIIEKQGLTEVPAIGIYYHAYFFVQEIKGEQHFQKFKSLLFAHVSLFSVSENRELFLMAVNFCIKQVNEGNQAYFQEMFQLYQKALALNVLLENGKLSRFTYYNAVASGIQTQAFEWTKKITYQYREFLEEEYQESAFHFNLARIEFEQNNYSEALSLINQAHFPDLLFNLAVKTIVLKIYFHLEEFDLLDAHLNAMNNFIRRNKILGYHRTNYLNIIRYTKKMLTINPYDKEALAQVRSTIQQEERLTERKWLLEQIRQMGHP